MVAIPLVSTNSNGIHEFGGKFKPAETGPVGDTVSSLVEDIVDKIEDKELNGSRTTAKEIEGLFTYTYIFFVSAVCLHFLYSAVVCLLFSDSDDDDDENELSLTEKLQRELKQAVKDLIAQHQQQKHRTVSLNFLKILPII